MKAIAGRLLIGPDRWEFDFLLLVCVMTYFDTLGTLRNYVQG